jgi:hypothetical protein
MLNKLNPIQIFTNNRLAAWFWFAVSVIVAAIKAREQQKEQARKSVSIKL